MGKSPCCAKEGINRGAWTPLEDKMLTEYIESHGAGKWASLPRRTGLKRCGKSCRLRWVNYLRPDIKRGNITDDEEDLIIRLHKLLGNRWSLIAGRLPGRTDNEIKNYWNTKIVKKIQCRQHLAACSSASITKPSSTRSRSQPLLQNLTRTDQPRNSEKLELKSCPHVIRTKARRCTKVFIDEDLQTSAGTQQPGIIVPAEAQAPPSSADAKGVVTESPPTFSGEEGYSSGFMMDFEMDDKFFSDFLSTDVVQFAHDFFEGAVPTGCQH